RARKISRPLGCPHQPPRMGSPATAAARFGMLPFPDTRTTPCRSTNSIGSRVATGQTPRARRERRRLLYRPAQVMGLAGRRSLFQKRLVGEPVIAVSDLTRRFGGTTALASVSLSLARGAVYGLVGPNGAGKTTLIKHILGLLRAESGSVRVFGLDPVAEPVGVLSRIG